MRSFVVPTLLSALALPAAASAQAPEAASEEPEPRFSLSLERVASANALFFRLDDEDDDEFKLRSKGITVGGPIANPLAAPRVAFDYLSKSGVTLGVGLAFGLGDLDSDEDGEEQDEGGFNLIMLAPRVGYRLQLADWFDLTPRAGVSFGYASIQEAEYRYCDYDDSGNDYCEVEEGDKVKLFAALANLEVAGTFRITDSFNVITAVSYDVVVAAKAKEVYGESSYDDEEESDSTKFKDGHLSSLQLWIGLGGYF